MTNTIGEIDKELEELADCTDPNEVKSKILSPVLDALTANNNDVYNQYLLSHKQSLNTLKNEINRQLKKADNALEGYSQQKSLGFHHWFEEELWKPLNTRILQELGILFDKHNENDQKFENEVNKVLVNCQASDVIPSEGKIEDYRNTHGGSYKIAYYMCISEVKRQLITKFKTLAKALKESESQLQLLVVKVLSEDGHLNRITSNKNVEFFNDIEKQLPLFYTDRIMLVFQEIKKSTDTYEDTIIGWIEPHLNQLNPDNHLDPISRKQNSPINLSNEEINQSILEEIDSLRNKVVDDCRKTLQNKLNYPNQEAYSKFDKFVTLAFKGETASRSWRIFYEANKSKLWPEAEQTEQYQQVEQEWQNLVNSALDALKSIN